MVLVAVSALPVLHFVGSLGWLGFAVGRLGYGVGGFHLHGFAVEGVLCPGLLGGL